ncbi:MAG: hypothetical protein OEZ06_12360 [Myxococcales bacterium]|nr:hypothetical protein [Myxococcales bacterium]
MPSTRTTRFYWFFLALLGAGACGDDGASGPVGGGDGGVDDGGLPVDSGNPADRTNKLAGDPVVRGPSIEELADMLVMALCTEIEACLGADVLAQSFGDESCVERFGAQLDDGGFARVQDAVDDGRVSYDPSATDACLASLTGLGCDVGTRRIESDENCAAIFVGSVEPGGACALDADCKGTAFCQLGDSCPGTCTELLAAGQACTDDDECQDGLGCDELSLRCVRPAQLGESCGGSIAADCKLGLSCVGDDEDMGIAGSCQDPAGFWVGELGETCNFDTATLCVEGLSCVIEVSLSGATFTCQEPVGSGEPCKVGLPMPCPAGEYCDGDVFNNDFAGDCVPLPGAGEPCAQTFGAVCAPGLQCDEDEKCRPVNRLGQPCISDKGCASDYCQDGLCIEPPLCTL